MQFHPLYEETSRRLEEALNDPRLFIFGRVNTWLVNGALPDEIIDVCTRVAKQGRWRGGNLAYFDGFIADAIAARTKPMPEAKPRSDRGGFERKETGYQPRPELPDDVRDKIDKGLADMLNRGMNVMSVTPQEARRFKERGWLNPQAVERLGL